VTGVWIAPDGEIQISLNLREAAACVRRPDGTVAVRVLEEQETLFTARRLPPQPARQPADAHQLPPEQARQPAGRVISIRQAARTRRG
jgi:hypothetical protein